MTYVPADFKTLPRMPSWVTAARPETPEDVALLSGVALSHLHLVVQNPALPHPLLRDRLALKATEAIMKLDGRPERATELRDEVHLARPGDAFGPGGTMFALWRAAVRMRVASSPRRKMPLAAAADALQDALETDPGNEAAALMAAETSLAQSLKWRHMYPVMTWALSRKDIQERDAELQRACARAVIATCASIMPLVHDLTRKAERLRAVEESLRAKGAGAAVALFLREDALSPSLALSPIIRGSSVRMTGRSARRLCDRLVELGAVRELTGRDTFRLYGV